MDVSLSFKKVLNASHNKQKVIFSSHSSTGLKLVFFQRDEKLYFILDDQMRKYDFKTYDFHIMSLE